MCAVRCQRAGEPASEVPACAGEEAVVHEEVAVQDGRDAVDGVRR